MSEDYHEPTLKTIGFSDVYRISVTVRRSAAGKSAMMLNGDGGLSDKC